MSQCQTYDRGERCTMPARRASNHCINHDPDYRKEHQANASRGGRNSGTARRHDLQPVDLAFISLTSRAAVQAMLDGLLRLELLGKLPPARGRMLIRILSLAVRNFDRPARTSALDAITGAVDRDGYEAVRQPLDAALPDVLETLHMNELSRLAEEIQAEMAHRTQRYRDEDNWQRGPAAKQKPKKEWWEMSPSEAWRELQPSPPPPDIDFAAFPNPPPQDNTDLYQLLDTIEATAAQMRGPNGA